MNEQARIQREKHREFLSVRTALAPGDEWVHCSVCRRMVAQEVLMSGEYIDSACPSCYEKINREASAESFRLDVLQAITRVENKLDAILERLK